MTQQLLVTTIVLLALTYVLWSFMSMARRQRILDWLAAHGIARAAAARHRARLATPGCSNCAGGGTVDTARQKSPANTHQGQP